MNYKKELLETLVDLRDCVPLLADRKQVVFRHFSYQSYFGICSNVEERITFGEYTVDEADGIMGIMDEVMYRWPHRNSEIGYPVGGSEEYMKEYDSKDIWNNPRRIQLLDWMIETLTLEIKNES